MAEILSLSKARKKKKRDLKEKTAHENRIKFGRTKAERKLSKAKEHKKERDLSGHKIED